MLTEVLEYGYEGLIKAAKQNFQYFAKCPLGFLLPIIIWMLFEGL